MSIAFGFAEPEPDPRVPGEGRGEISGTQFVHDSRSDSSGHLVYDHSLNQPHDGAYLLFQRLVETPDEAARDPRLIAQMENLETPVDLLVNMTPEEISAEIRRSWAAFEAFGHIHDEG
ncbi:hypothetical protein [Alkalilacustris brevis]|uniref:hypothetical protein n=1 Tax=Alkalilacustris brevis TaxID=2026338 RepID=UPI000E0E02F3|nr:hypothetical protein [Alkalilacustris brevis]